MKTTQINKSLIIIGESDLAYAETLVNCLTEQGYPNVAIAQDGHSIYQLLRPHYRQPEKVGALLVNENLPACQFHELCLSLACTPDAYAVPITILGTMRQSALAMQLGKQYEISQLNGMIHFLSQPVQLNELLSALRFQLAIKHERQQRLVNEALLSSELAERKVIDAKLKYLIAHDELTGLLNRQSFERHIATLIKRNQKLPKNGALLYLDIDRFSLINELEGYETGDRLLIEAVTQLRSFVTKANYLARIGSDEFCLYLDNVSQHDVRQFAESVRRALDDFKFFVENVVYNATISVGMAYLNSDKPIRHPSELIARARQACRLAKENGRNMCWEYNDNDSVLSKRHSDAYWTPLIRRALLESKFLLLYQPVVDLIQERISHYEVLLRMIGDDAGDIIGPAEFIPVAERMGLIHHVDAWVVENAIDFLATLPDFMGHVSLAVNLSSYAFQDQTLLTTIKDKLESTWVDPRRLMFEITETSAVDNFEQTRNMIVKIRALGCKFALDDFGAGFCSFSYLKKFPVDFIKIDGQFIQNLVDDETDQVLVKSIVEIAAKLGKKTIAEYVENAALVRKLQDIGIDLAQGYFFGSPSRTLQPSSTISIEALILNEHINYRGILNPFMR
ncbi:GGDEF and EAL domain-containing protein [Methylocucumis oryzae]|uniref:Diguanylate cyclase n=1 Tax=Methylocucumis oryzae TaxID=1632867 RepID=A0A0F3IM03_9GAMM|nr:GGDEF and EAL domain-containing protein [Methylocucumis oryzae]KJV07800.1 hypothetical protein VZ94_02185 [Methylocucumis oryzae]